MLRDNVIGRSTYYHTPPYQFLKTRGRYCLLFLLIESGRLHVDTERGIIYRRRTVKRPFRVAKLERDKKGYRFLRLYTCIEFTGPNGHKYKRYYRQAICVQIIVWLVGNGLTDIPLGYEVDHRNDRNNDNRFTNLQLLTVQANTDKRVARYYRDNPELADATF